MQFLLLNNTHIQLIYIDVLPKNDLWKITKKKSKINLPPLNLRLCMLSWTYHK